jgi:flavin reductase (DIM6/NTAB) family NADH-FMN oxidoreductase RutF
MRHYAKKDFPVENIRRFLEPGPVVLISSAYRNETNIMTMGWHMVVEFQPSLVGCIISNANHSFRDDPQKPAMRENIRKRSTIAATASS